jgi:hypothetical protein
LVGPAVTGPAPLGLGPEVAAGRTPLAAAVSRDRKAPSSWMVLMSGAGKTTVVF